MTPRKPEHWMSLPATPLANVPLFCGLTAVALGGLFYYFDAFAVDQDIRGFPKDRVEDFCLWLAAMAGTIGFATSIVGFIVIRRSGCRVRGAYRLSIGMVFNLLAVVAVLFALYVRAVLNGANAA